MPTPLCGLLLQFITILFVQSSPFLTSCGLMKVGLFIEKKEFYKFNVLHIILFIYFPSFSIIFPPPPSLPHTSFTKKIFVNPFHQETC